jgi:hypothetical protein
MAPGSALHHPVQHEDLVDRAIRATELDLPIGVERWAG